MVSFEGDVMVQLNEVDRLQNGQTLANRGNTHFFKIFRAHYAEHVPSQVML